MSDKEIALELVKILSTRNDAFWGDDGETDLDVSLSYADTISEMYERIYNKVHSLKD